MLLARACADGTAPQLCAQLVFPIARALASALLVALYCSHLFQPSTQPGAYVVTCRHRCCRRRRRRFRRTLPRLVTRWPRSCSEQTHARSVLWPSSSSSSFRSSASAGACEQPVHFHSITRPPRYCVLNLITNIITRRKCSYFILGWLHFRLRFCRTTLTNVWVCVASGQKSEWARRNVLSLLFDASLKNN